MITDSDVARFKQLYLARFGEEIADDQARESLTLLVSQMHAIYGPIRRSDVIAIKDVDVEQDGKPRPHTA